MTLPRSFFAPLGLLALFAAGLGGGWWLAQRNRAQGSAALPAETARRPAPLTASSKLAPRVAWPEGFSAQDISSMPFHGSMVQQMRAALAFAERCPLAEIPRHLARFRGMNERGGVANYMLAYFLTARLVEADPEAAWQQAMNAPTGSTMYSQPDQMMVLDFLVADNPDFLLADPERLQTFLKKAPNIEDWPDSILRRMADASPELLAEQLPTLKDDLKLAPLAIEVLWRTDPEGAKRYALEKDKVGELMNKWKQTDPEAAVRWIAENVPDPSKAGFALQAWAARDLPGALAFYENEASAGMKESMLRALVVQQSSENPAGTVEWIMRQPESKEQDRALGSAIGMWTMQDPEAASAWLRAQPASAEHDRMVRSLAIAAQVVDPPMSLEWAKTISDDKERLGIIELNFSRWRSVDPAAAKTWLQNDPDLSEEVRQKLANKK